MLNNILYCVLMLLYSRLKIALMIINVFVVYNYNLIKNG